MRTRTGNKSDYLPLLLCRRSLEELYVKQKQLYRASHHVRKCQIKVILVTNFCRILAHLHKKNFTL